MRKNMEIAGKNPAIPVEIGKANIPAPIQQPATRRVPPKAFPVGEEVIVVLEFFCNKSN
jgi:hypothetical protein